MTTRQLYYTLYKNYSKRDKKTGSLLNRNFIDSMDNRSLPARICLFRFINCISEKKMHYLAHATIKRLLYDD